MKRFYFLMFALTISVFGMFAETYYGVGALVAGSMEEWNETIEVERTSRTTLTVTRHGVPHDYRITVDNDGEICFYDEDPVNGYKWSWYMKEDDTKRGNDGGPLKIVLYKYQYLNMPPIWTCFQNVR